MNSFVSGAFKIFAAFALVAFVSPLVAFADDMDFGSLNPDSSSVGEAPASTAPSVVGSDAGSDVASDAVPISTSSAGQRRSALSEIRRNLGVGFFNYSNTATNEVNRGRGNLESYNYLSLEYRTGRGEKVFVRPAFLFQTEGRDLRGFKRDSKFDWSDLYVGYSSYNIPWLPFNMDYKTELRAYFPTSDSSQNEGMIARLRGDLKAHYPLTHRLTFLLWFKPDYFVQSREVKSKSRGVAYGTRAYGYELSANLYYQLRGGVFGFGGAVGHEQSWTNSSEVDRLESYRREDVAAQAFLGINAYGLLTHIGVDQIRDVARPRDAFVAFRDTEMQYFARSYYRF